MAGSRNNLLYVTSLNVALFLFVLTTALAAQHDLGRVASVKPSVNRISEEQPILFEENQGQIATEVRYFARGRDFLFLLSSREVLWSFRGIHAADDLVRSGEKSCQGNTLLRLGFDGSKNQVQLVPEETASFTTSYIMGANRSNWRTGIRSHRRIRYKEIYAGIDLVFYGKNGRMEYDFVVSPGADPEQIRLRFSGIDEARISEDGELVLATEVGELRQMPPSIYQERAGNRVQIAGRFQLEDNGSVAFEIDSYDHGLPLTIDPVLVYSTYLGGSKGETPGAVTVDSEGNLYLIGSTGSLDFPIHTPWQEEFAGGGSPLGDVFVTKFDSSGSSIVYSTYIGGGSTDIGRSLAVDSLGQVVATGTTFSNDFPSTPGAFQPSCSGQCPFVFQLSSDGSQLNYGTFVGRGDGIAVALDHLERPVITGKTTSSEFPVKNAFQEESPGQSDAFLTKLTGDATELVFSTFLGGSADDNLLPEGDIATDTAGNTYVVGRTESDDFPTLKSVQGDRQGEEDVFVSKFDADGGLVYSTYLGGSEDDIGLGIAADTDGSAYVTGGTKSLDFPNQQAFQASFGGGVAIGDAFVSKILPEGDELVYSTYLGGQLGDIGTDISVDSLKQAVVVGAAGAGFPVRQALWEFDGIDNYVTKLNADGSDLVYSTPIGDGDQNTAVTTFGTDVFVAGKNSVGSSPILNASQPRSNGFAEVFLAHIADSGTLYFAQFGEGEGAVSDILLTNSSAVSPSSATVSFRGDDGSPVSVSVTVTGDANEPEYQENASDLDVVVSPLGAVQITTSGVGPIVTGSVFVNFDVPLGGVIRFNLSAFGIAGVNQSALVRGFITPARKTGVNTGVAIVNSEDRQIGLTLRLRDRAGEEIPGGLRSLAIDPEGHLARFITELFPNADLTGFEGTLTVEVNTLNALIGATALELGGSLGQFTTLPVTPLP